MKGKKRSIVSPPTQSFTAAIEQMAKMLRSQVKLKERKTEQLPLSSFPSSFQNALEQLAKLLRTEIHEIKITKRRSWKRQKS